MLADKLVVVVTNGINKEIIFASPFHNVNYSIFLTTWLLASARSTSSTHRQYYPQERDGEDEKCKHEFWASMDLCFLEMAYLPAQN